MRQNIILFTGLSILSGATFAQSLLIAPQPAACMDANFSAEHSSQKLGQTVAVTLTNHCGQTVDLQNASITFLNTTELNTLYWGLFSPLSYPSNPLQISSQPSEEGYLATLSMAFAANAQTELPDGAVVTLYYVARTGSYIDNSAKVYLNSAVKTGSLRLVNATSKPENVDNSYTLITLSMNGEPISTIPLPWSGQQVISGLAPGVYDIAPITVDANDEEHQYEGRGNVTQLTVSSGDTSSATITYAEKTLSGSLRLQLQDLPEELNGYSDLPQISLTRDDTNSTHIASVQWGATQEIDQLALNKVAYHFAAADIFYNGYTCTPEFVPATTVVTSVQPQVALNYSCVKTTPDLISLRIEGAPASLSAVTVTFTPAGNAEPITETVSLIDGEGNSSLSFKEGTIYSVTADELEGYSATYSANIFTAMEGAIETVSYVKNQTNSEVLPTVVTIDPTAPEVVSEPEALVIPEVVTAEPEAAAVIAETTVTPEVTAEPEVVETTVMPEVIAEPEALIVEAEL